MKEIDRIRFVDEATGGGVNVSVYQREDATLLLDLQLPDRAAMVVSLPCALAKRLAEAIVRAIP